MFICLCLNYSETSQSILMRFVTNIASVLLVVMGYIIFWLDDASTLYTSFNWIEANKFIWFLVCLFICLYVNYVQTRKPIFMIFDSYIVPRFVDIMAYIRAQLGEKSKFYVELNLFEILFACLFVCASSISERVNRFSGNLTRT